MSAILKPEFVNRRSAELPRPELVPFLDALAATIADQIVAEWSAGKHNNDSTASDDHQQTKE